MITFQRNDTYKKGIFRLWKNYVSKGEKRILNVKFSRLNVVEKEARNLHQEESYLNHRKKLKTQQCLNGRSTEPFCSLDFLNMCKEGNLELTHLIQSLTPSVNASLPLESPRCCRCFVIQQFLPLIRQIKDFSLL